MRVPEDIAGSVVKVTLSFDDCKVFPVAPATVEIAIQSEQPDDDAE